jgi:hypothetical protein
MRWPALIRPERVPDRQSNCEVQISCSAFAICLSTGEYIIIVDALRTCLAVNGGGGQIVTETVTIRDVFDRSQVAK